MQCVRVFELRLSYGLEKIRCLTLMLLANRCATCCRKRRKGEWRRKKKECASVNCHLLSMKKIRCVDIFIDHILLAYHYWQNPYQK